MDDVLNIQLTIWSILDRLDVASINQLRRVNKLLHKLCSKDEYWQHRIEYEFGITSSRSDNRETFDKIAKCYHGYWDELGSHMESAIKQGSHRLVGYYVDIIILKQYWTPRCILYLLGKINRLDLVDRILGGFNIDESKPYWNVLLRYVFRGAARYGHLELVQELIGRGIRDFNILVCEAASGGHRMLVNEYFTKSDVTPHTITRCAARGGHFDLVIDYLDMNDNSRYEVLILAIMYGHSKLAIKLLDYDLIDLSYPFVWAIDHDLDDVTNEVIRRGGMRTLFDCFCDAYSRDRVLRYLMESTANWINYMEG